MYLFDGDKGPRVDLSVVGHGSRFNTDGFFSLKVDTTPSVKHLQKRVLPTGL